jgi:hypothetical protein
MPEMDKRVTVIVVTAMVVFFGWIAYHLLTV